VLATEARTGSDEAVLSFKGAWVLSMLRDEMGEERMLAGLRALLAKHAEDRAAATPADLLRVLRAHHPVPSDFDAFVAQWLEGAALPEFELSNAAATATPEGWHLRATIRNVGTGTVTVAVAAEGTQTASGSGPVPKLGPSVRVEEGVPRTIEWRVRFQPARIVVDPDVRVLQRNRERAVAAVIVGAGG
jgi:aminopeptidase N